MFIIFVLLLTTIKCLNTSDTKVILTDFENNNSPVYVIAPYYESYQIDLFDPKDVLQNTSFSNNSTSNQNLSAQINNFIEFTQDQLDYPFCPIDEWAPLYQPARFYLSQSALDLLFYNESDDHIVQVQQQLHKDLYEISDTFETINCYSIFELRKDYQFGLDCDVNAAPTIIIFNITYNDNGIISNSTPHAYYQYQYADQEQQKMLTGCSFRKTMYVKIFDDANQLQSQYLQYCPSQWNSKETNNQFLIVYRDHLRRDNIYEFQAYAGNVNQLNSCETDQYTLIESIFSNSMINGYDSQTWNIGFLFQSTPLICKCIIQQILTSNYHISCKSTLIEMFQPNQIRLVQTLNEEVVLVTGTNTAVLVLFLERSYQSQNYVALSYKQIYEPGYKLIDLSITSQFIAVILTDSEILYDQSPYFNKPSILCDQQKSGNAKYIMKIFYINEEYQSVYYQSNDIQQMQGFLNSLNQNGFGNFFLLYDYVQKQLNIITIFNKKLVVSYLLGFTNQTETFNSPIAPVIISFDINGGYFTQNLTTQLISYQIKQFTRHIVICFIKLEDNRFQLVAEVYKFDPNDEPLTICPISRDIHIFQEIINSIDLFEGIMGPLLNFNYVPNYNMSKYYPFYQNHKSTFTKNKYQEEYGQIKQIYKVLSALNRNIFITSNIFGVIEILLTYDQYIESSTNLNSHNSRAIIINSTCIINAREYQQMQKQFPLQVEIQECTERRVRNLTPYMTQVDYYREFYFYDIAVQYENSIIVVCEKSTKIIGSKICQNVTNMQQIGITIQQIDILQGPVENNRVLYFITVLFSNQLNVLQFFSLAILQPSLLILEIIEHNATNYYNITTKNDIVSFRYTFINQQTLFLLFVNAQITIYTPGPSNSTSDKKLYIFTSILTNTTITIPQCVNNSFIGFEITNYFQSKLAKQFLVVWCQDESYVSYLLQFIITNINEIDFWRRLPHYDTFLTNKTNVLISGQILYVPIQKKTVYNDYFQYYYIYNLEDYTPRCLVEEIEVEKRRDEQIITSPIDNLIDSVISGSSISLTLIITQKKFEIFYLNQRAEFIFHLQQQFIETYNLSPMVLVIAVYQPTKTITMFRNYTLVYNFSGTQITFSYQNQEPYYLTVDPVYLSLTGGFYQYLLLVNQSFFNGPIASYWYTTDQKEMTIIPSPYLQMNKYLGSFMETIDTFGQAIQIIDLGDEIYNGLYVQTIIDPITSESIQNTFIYSDLIIVLTDSHLLFYQKKSNPSQNKSCYFTNYTQSNPKSLNQSKCSIRLIANYSLLTIENHLYCQMQLNGINAVVLVCQTKFFSQFTYQMIKQNKENNQQFQYFSYSYDQENNQINFSKPIIDKKQFCYCYFSDMQPFLYQNQVYQMIKTGYYKVNTYFGIYIIDVSSEAITFVQNSTYPNQNSSIPYQNARDYALSVISYNDQTYLYLIILQTKNILVQVIEMTTGFPSNQKAYYLTFSEDQDFVRQENALFIQALNHFQPHKVNSANMKQSIIVGNNNQVFEISFDVLTFEASLSYTFYQYLLCHHDFLSRPQIQLSYENDTVHYLVTQCLSNQFEYQSIQVEMTYLLNELNTNIVYTSLFIRNFSRNYSRPVEILEPYLVNPQELHLQKIQLYQVFDSQSIENSRSHLLITNSTYFLLDLLIYEDNGYYLYYPINLAQQDEDSLVTLSITAQNSYSSYNATFVIEWYMQDSQVNSQAWFYAILTIVCIAILILILVLIAGRCKTYSTDEESDATVDLKKNDDKSDDGVELQRAEMNQQMLFGDVIKDIFRNNPKKQPLSYMDELDE